MSSRVNTADDQKDELYLMQRCNVKWRQVSGCVEKYVYKSPLLPHYMHDPLLCDSAGCLNSSPARRFFYGIAKVEIYFLLVAAHNKTIEDIGQFVKSW